MKIVLNTYEATNLFSQLANTDKLAALEAELASVRLDLENADASKRDAWHRNERLESETYELRQTNEDVRREIADLRRQLPNYKERRVSKMFALYAGGRGNVIATIKAVRSLLNLGLKEAKDVVEGTFQNGTMPEAFALCTVLKGLKSGAAIGDVRTELVKTGLVDGLVNSAGGLEGGEQLTNDLNRILHGEFHDGANIEF